MVAVRVLVPDAFDLAQLRSVVRIYISSVSSRGLPVAVEGGLGSLVGVRIVCLCEILAGQQEHLFVKAADHWDFGGLLRRRRCAVCRF